MRTEKGVTVIEMLIAVATIATLVAFLATGLGGFSRSEGNRIGQVTKFSHKGIFWTTWEGELLMGGVRINGEGNSVANVWQFSVIDTSVVEQLRKAMDGGSSVNLHYKQVIFPRPWNGSTTYYVDSVKIIRSSQ